MVWVTKQDLTRAISDRLSVPRAVAAESAEYVLELFGFEEQVIDNVLDAEDRQLFYNLESCGILTTRSEETQLYNGQEWRTHYWLLRSDRVLAASEEERAREARREAEAAGADVYAELPAECWARG